MSTVTRVQHLLGIIAPTRVNHHPVQRFNPRSSTEAANLVETAARQPTVQPSGVAPAWDPHEVWLNRVKKPREQRQA